MKNVLLICFLSIISVALTAGCDSSFLDSRLASGERTPSVDIYGAPENAPTLNLFLTQDDYPDKSLQAAQLTTSWSFFNEDGTVTGYEADSMHALQLDDYLYDVTLKLDGSNGVVEMQFSDSFPPEYIYIQLWEVEHAYGGQDISDLEFKGEPVVVRSNSFDVTNKGNDYVFEIYAKWENNGYSYYAFYLEIDSEYAVELGGVRNDIGLDLDIGESIKFTNVEIMSAVDMVFEKFTDFTGCELTHLWYDEEKSETFINGYMTSGRGQGNGILRKNVIVLLSNFDVDSSGGDGSLNPNSTYYDWNWILVRDNESDSWRVDDWGY